VRDLWDIAVRPALEAAGARVVIEVGAHDAEETRRLAAWCRTQGARLFSVDPSPAVAADVLADADVDVEVDRRQSLEVLGGGGVADVVLLHGPRDRYTVARQLELLLAGAEAAGVAAPVIACHGAGEGDGALRAVEEAVAGAGGRLVLTAIPVLGGLALVTPRARLEAQPRLAEWVASWDTAAPWRELLALVAPHGASAGDPPLADQRLDGVRGRSFRPALTPDAIGRIQEGSLEGTHRGRRMVTAPFDQVLYAELVARQRTGTVIEVGTMDGGGALWFADVMAANGLRPKVVTIDLEPPADLADDRVSVLTGDAAALGGALPADLLATLPKPWLVREDSAHTYSVTLAAMRFFHEHLVPGDYLVVEDGILADLPDPVYRRWEDGPNRAVARFLEDHPADYRIDEALCDRFGHNVTWAPNAWLRRV
jgi:cephalosporin hydroxylase